jgi:hypothetical protein
MKKCLNYFPAKLSEKCGQSEEKQKPMPMRYLGKLLFPRRTTGEQRHQMKQLIAAVVVAIIFAGVIVTIMFLLNRRP